MNGTIHDTVYYICNFNQIVRHINKPKPICLKYQINSKYICHVNVEFKQILQQSLTLYQDDWWSLQVKYYTPEFKTGMH